MKKIFILPVVLIFSLLTLLSCSKGDDDNTVDSSESLIQGLWILKVRTKDGVTYPLTPCEKKFSNLEFQANHYCIDSYGFTRVNGECVSQVDNYAFSIADGILTMKQNGSASQYESHHKILELTKEKIVINTYSVTELVNGKLTEYFFPKNELQVFTYVK